MDLSKRIFGSNGTGLEINGGMITMEQEEVNNVVVSILSEYGECPALGILLCYWNNIIGPHAHYVWQIEGKPTFSEEQLKYLSTHTLTSSDNPANSINSKLLFLKDHQMVVAVFLFSGYQNTQRVTFALSLVVPFHLKEWYMAVHSFCQLRLTGLVRRLRVLQEKYKNEKDSPAIHAFSSKVPDFLRSLTRLANCGIPKKIELDDTVFASGQDKHLDVQFMRNHENYAGVLITMKVESLHDYWIGVTTLKWRAIAGHLQSCGCSIVLGNNVTEVNMVLNTLALFLSPAERQCSLLLTEGCSHFPFKYEKDVMLQGFLKDSFHTDDNILEIMTSRYPTTLVDLTTLEVKHMHHFNEHEYMKHEVITKELQKLWLESLEPIPILRFVKDIEPETLVQNLQKEMYILHPQGGVREAFLSHFARLLDRKALALIKFVEDETHRGKDPTKISLRKVRNDLDLHPEGNCRIVLAAAEKLQPGIYSLVCGSLAARSREANDV